MKVCIIQPPYPYTINEADAAVQFIIDELNKCGEDIDLILTPEYSNAPTVYPKGECIPYAKAHTEPLISAARAAAVRCNAVVAVNYAADIDGKYRNTTRVFRPDGSVAGDYYKQHLPPSEVLVKGMDGSYTYEYRTPTVVEVDGIRYGFLTCYDCYFNEYIQHLAKMKLDIILVSSHQRSERWDILDATSITTAFYCNAFVVRSSVDMGAGADTGGSSMVVDPSGKILAKLRQGSGSLVCDIGDPKKKYARPYCFGGANISNVEFVERGRVPWVYRPAGSAVKPSDEQTPYPRVCAHRGFNTIAPENSLPAFGAAVALGADEIEFDVNVSADGELIVIHDKNVGRVTDGSGLISGMTLAEIKQLDAGIKYSPHFRGLRLCTLEEVLRVFPRQTIINLHIKSPKNEVYDPAVLLRIRDLLDKYDCLEHVYFMAKPDILELALEYTPEIARCCSSKPDPMNIVSRAVKYKCRKVQLIHENCTEEIIAAAHDEGIKCNLFWCDDPVEAKKYLDMGVDTILTNDYLRVSLAVKEWIAENGVKN